MSKDEIKKEECRKLVIKALQRVMHLPSMQAEWQLWSIQDFIKDNFGEEKERQFKEACLLRDIYRLNEFIRYL